MTIPSIGLGALLLTVPVGANDAVDSAVPVEATSAAAAEGVSLKRFVAGIPADRLPRRGEAWDAAAYAGLQAWWAAQEILLTDAFPVATHRAIATDDAVNLVIESSPFILKKSSRTVFLTEATAHAHAVDRARARRVKTGARWRVDRGRAEGTVTEITGRVPRDQTPEKDVDYQERARALLRTVGSRELQSITRQSTQVRRALSAIGSAQTVNASVARAGPGDAKLRATGQKSADYYTAIKDDSREENAKKGGDDYHYTVPDSPGQKQNQADLIRTVFEAERRRWYIKGQEGQVLYYVGDAREFRAAKEAAKQRLLAAVIVGALDEKDRTGMKKIYLFHVQLDVTSEPAVPSGEASSE